MSKNLTGQYIDDTYKAIVTITNDTGLTGGTLQNVGDGAGVNSP